METAKVLLSGAALAISILSFFIAQRSAARAKKAESIYHLLGEKETVAFAALKLLRDGLPRDLEERKLVLSALLQACVFEGSDRARALLYRVIECERKKYGNEIQDAFKSISDTFDSMDRYGFQQEELDLVRGRRRLSSVERVICTP